ncbi:MAG: hypothetical protein A3G87_09085 [Omnitrophica bacterium RIFCSPLOWO2_12_FULL_50_11]|nr:MAG: hypothetical protein A3G87_09085 [Omnitrophica bacterium RIFCSPLOWO2_12_FULL_50_11]
MLRQLLRRGQLTIPVELLKKFGLKEKDYVRIDRTDDGILIQPVAVLDYSPAELEKLRKKLNQLPRGNKIILHSASESKKHLDELKTK